MELDLRPVLDVGGLLVSSFVVHAGLAIATLLILNPILAKVRARRVIWNLPLAEFGLLVCLIGLYTILL
ncbi:hypothetical protein AA0312_1534 [Acetobacter tropicalis NRIC 0312]|jgi:hypothetical protein|uniref:DUF1656 domain-containing protein n=1 Tax=Acetobacter tropicalis TaxID=104102 RepID=A0A0C9LH72_9PROT|nr:MULTISPECIES: DUF1656 domain-containing protein [Acetobacter]KXV50050.1 hypothetical protein AD944_06270 [Acetobacter tropicalis]KXV56027.1 hypothetical protein AD947_13335 [Acetobacter tropicalis]MDN7352987.1 DUF1656 domain-containing protein [Acetobacter senegalensis]OUI86130.1 hypothetical protein HC62_08230 [Acetobacter tropicalis]GAL97503.1 conserved hypothetical protein [Acetobacter tropicalis]